MLPTQRGKVIPGGGTKISYSVQHGQKMNNNKNNLKKKIVELNLQNTEEKIAANVELPSENILQK